MIEFKPNSVNCYNPPSCVESCRAPDNVNVAVVVITSCDSPHIALNVCVNTFIPGKISVGGQVHSYV